MFGGLKFALQGHQAERKLFDGDFFALGEMELGDENIGLVETKVGAQTAEENRADFSVLPKQVISWRLSGLFPHPLEHAIWSPAKAHGKCTVLSCIFP